MSAQPQARLSPEQYLEIERAAETRNEYYNGRMYAMSGASVGHIVITSNLNRGLSIALRKRARRVGTNDFRVRVSPDRLYTYPDLVVFCGEPKFADARADTLLNPVFLAEVISPSTEAYDRGFKSAQYRTLDSLQEYALISQSEPRVEVFRRQTGGTWLLSESVGLDTSCLFDSLGCEIPLSEIYDKVSFEGEEPMAP
jgi:Uma2 family endonuclease